MRLIIRIGKGCLFTDCYRLARMWGTNRYGWRSVILWGCIHITEGTSPFDAERSSGTAEAAQRHRRSSRKWTRSLLAWWICRDCNIDGCERFLLLNTRMETVRNYGICPVGGCLHKLLHDLRLTSTVASYKIGSAMCIGVHVWAFWFTGVTFGACLFVMLLVMGSLTVLVAIKYRLFSARLISKHRLGLGFRLRLGLLYQLWE